MALNVSHFIPGRSGALRGLIFDCDGVLLDSRGSNISYYNLYRARLGLPPMTPDQEDYIHMHAVRESLLHITPPELLHRIEEVRAQLDYSEVLPSLVMEPGLVELLEFLRGRGVRLAVNTNRTTTMHMVLDHFGLQDFFEPVVTAGDVQNPKPHPESLLKILDIWGLPRQELAFLGDSRVDEGTAHAADVPFWAYKNGQLRAECHVDGFAGLLSVLRSGPSAPSGGG